MKAWDYVKPFILYLKKCGYRLPMDLIRYIYSFLLHDIHKQLSINFITNRIRGHVRDNGVRFWDDSFTIHFNEIPYFTINSDNRIKCKNAIISSINAISRKQYDFGHYCCSGKGLVIKNTIDNLNPRRYIM
jgi:hypothetical protein|tara:strand:+ start:136 stop:528 length:393 start_codon:yes stop_codon:yes gene_type:complete